jgi:hypothetical protein
MSNSNFSDNWKCAISGSLMKDPVSTPEGISYDRPFIEEWLKTSQTCPITRSPLRANQLIPNIALRNTIQDYLKSQATVPTDGSVGPVASTSSVLSEPIVFDLETNTTKHNHSILAHIKVKPPSYGNRLPVGISLAIDVSDSMKAEASVQNEKIEIVGYSRLDVVKHSANTVIESLGDNDVLSLTKFTTDSTLILPPMKMNSFGKKRALDCIKNLRPEHATNLWSGLEKSLDATNSSIFNGTNKHVLILTDGESNTDPPRGIMAEFNRYIERTNSTVNVHTFAYGYNLDVKLLFDITKKSNGTYAYLPDCTMVGTVFINFLSYVMATISTNNMLSIVPLNGTVIDNVYGYSDSDPSNINIGNIQYGQSRDFVVRITPGSTAPYLKAVLNSTVEKEISTISTERNNDILLEFVRLRFVELLTPNVLSISANYGFIQSFYSEVFDLDLGDKAVPFLTDLKSTDENEGQISKAFSKPEWYAKWGQYYIPAIRRANQLQYCNNFKDKTVAQYGGRLFSELQDRSNDIFVRLIPPPPSLEHLYTASVAPGTNTGTGTNAPRATLNATGGSTGNTIGCFSGYGQIDTPTGKWYVKEVHANDMIMTPDGPAKVLCVIKSKIRGGLCKLVNIDGLLITEWHPVRIKGKWYFPKEYPLGKYDEFRCEYVYDFVLDKGHIALINGVECVTLAHNFQEDIVKHSFFGTEAVVRDLEKMPGWIDGQINIETSHFTYDTNTGLINGWIFDS